MNFLTIARSSSSSSRSSETALRNSERMRSQFSFAEWRMTFERSVASSTIRVLARFASTSALRIDSSSSRK